MLSQLKLDELGLGFLWLWVLIYWLLTDIDIVAVVGLVDGEVEELALWLILCVILLLCVGFVVISICYFTIDIFLHALLVFVMICIFEIVIHFLLKLQSQLWVLSLFAIELKLTTVSFLLLYFRSDIYLHSIHLVIVVTGVDEIDKSVVYIELIELVYWWWSFELILLGL